MKDHLPHMDDRALQLTWYVVGLVGIAISIIVAIAGILK
jgi:hypothetical protein